VFAVCCSTAVWCSVVQCGAVCCSLLQCAAMCCSMVRVLQCAAVCCSVLQRAAVWCRVLQCAAVCCSMVQHGAVWCSVLQCAAVCCSNTDNVSFKYVDSTLSIKSLKTKILMHSNKDLKTHINLCVKIDKGICNLRKLIESSDAIPPKTKYEKSLQDVLALQCVAVWCSVLQHVALRCSVASRCAGVVVCCSVV